MAVTARMRFCTAFALLYKLMMKIIIWSDKRIPPVSVVHLKRLYGSFNFVYEGQLNGIRIWKDLASRGSCSFAAPAGMVGKSLSYPARCNDFIYDDPWASLAVKTEEPGR